MADANPSGRTQARQGNLGNGSGCGVLLVDKQAGITSHDAVAALRRLAGIRRVGHAGTLDPFASGLLLILVGRATRFFDLLAPLAKKYKVLAQFGARSTTGDIAGEITPVPGAVTEAGLKVVLPRYTGTIIQRVPAYSAVRQGGERLYKMARRGEPVAPPLRQAVVHSLKLESFDEAAQQARLAVSCAKGTYIRSLVEDIAGALGAGAYAAALRRVGVGNFKVEDAATLDTLAQFERGALLGWRNPSFLSPVSALYFLPVRELEAIEMEAVKSGCFLTGDETGPVLLTSAGSLLAVYQPAGRGRIRPQVVLT